MKYAHVKHTHKSAWKTWPQSLLRIGKKNANTQPHIATVFARCRMPSIWNSQHVHVRIFFCQCVCGHNFASHRISQNSSVVDVVVVGRYDGAQIVNRKHERIRRQWGHERDFAIASCTNNRCGIGYTRNIICAHPQLRGCDTTPQHRINIPGGGVYYDCDGRCVFLRYRWGEWVDG